ncbi:hypothetical protein EVAR_30653_1 [Eumeta japonica]|uniref:Uncharacterized protein n=1 Tax=Eumeta variegata TaxID=151549 RepID=A0A4C1VTS1_EUMVA|nr:hypothetical protein EVAR_30653_1 [Eumeta japonica]
MSASYTSMKQGRSRTSNLLGILRVRCQGQQTAGMCIRYGRGAGGPGASRSRYSRSAGRPSNLYRRNTRTSANRAPAVARAKTSPVDLVGYGGRDDVFPAAEKQIEWDVSRQQTKSARCNALGWSFVGLFFARVSEKKCSPRRA